MELPRLSYFGSVIRCLAFVLCSIEVFVTSGSFANHTIQAEYDFVIVGGGTAGLVVANRLSECANRTVLVLEAGPRPETLLTYRYPASFQLYGTLLDWDFGTIPQVGLNNRILSYHRGRALGGSSAINGIYYGRGSATVYDKWGELGKPWVGLERCPSLFRQGQQKVAFLSRAAYIFFRSASFVPPDPSDGFDNRYKTWDPSAYAEGPLKIGFQGYVADSSPAFIEALAAANVPIVEKLNADNNTGVRQGTATIDDQYRRSSSYDSFHRAAAHRPKLKVLYDAEVQTISVT